MTYDTNRTQRKPPNLSPYLLLQWEKVGA